MTRFYRGIEDCQWLCDTHLKGFTYPKFQSFMLTGNEDCPERIELYKDANPYMVDYPVATFNHWIVF